MGYEIAGGWGARIAQMQREPEQDTIVFVGDGSYLMLNSDIYSSVLTRKKLIVLVLDNGGFAVINKLQNNTGNESFNNLLVDARRFRNPSPSISRPMPPRWGRLPRSWRTRPSWARPSSEPKRLTGLT